ncbi:EAL domain-containing protein [Ectothiorhodospira shaposhnikovii]|uniref:EAL domain-containing protein n=1 Tax=Ectothiorhodospira shaposhnikovii TaxID=1054 RepID=UPI0039A34C79
MASKMPLLNAATLRERAKQILRDHSFDSTLFSLQRGELDVETLLEELHIYHAELRIQQEALLESQTATELALSRFSRLYQELPLPVLRIDWSGFLQDANSAAHRTLALNRRLFTQLSEAKHRNFLENALERARHDGRSDCQAVRLRRADGRPLIADIALIRLPEPDGAKPGFICSIVDQTPLIQQRDALMESYARLQESEDNYRILATFSPDWDFWLGHDGEFRYISPACARITGYSAEDFMDDPELMERIIHPDDLPRYQSHKTATDRTLDSAPVQFRILTKSGETRWVEHVCNPVMDAHGEFMGYRGINRDITERQNAQDSLEHQLRFQAMLANISSLFVNTRIEHMDPAMVQALQQIGRFFQAERCRILEYSPDRNALELTHHWSGLEGDGTGPDLRRQWHVTQLPWTTHRMRAREVLMLEKGPGQPPEFAREHQLLSPDNARSVRLVPMISDGEILGLLLLESFGQLPAHHWQEQPDQMRMVAENLAGMIIRCRAQKELQESEARYRHICAVTSDIAYACLRDDRGTLQIDWMTDSIQAMTGYSVADIRDRGSWEFLVLDEDQAIFKREILELEPGRASCCELRLRSKLGPPRWVRATSECIPSSHPTGPVRLYGGLIDITEQKRQQSRIQRLALVVEQSPSIVLVTDREARIEYINARFSQLTGFSREEIQGQPLALIHPHDAAMSPDLDGILHDLSAGRIWSGELAVRKKSGEHFWEQATLTPLKNTQGDITHFVKMSEDLSDRKALSEQLSYLAHYDPLTGLPKRAVMRECLQHAMVRVRHNGDHLAIFSIDVDDLKRVNDSLGHAAGDELLRILSDRLQGLLGKEDTLARLGGDHFLLLKAHMAQTQDALHLAERIQQLVEQPLTIQDQSLVVTASTGIALFPGDADTVDELMRRGDAALHRSKNDGEGRAYCFFTSTMDKQLKDQFQLEQALRRGLERDELLLHFQPRVDMATGQIQSLEALVRWLHPEQGLLPPHRFIPVAESSGLILSLGPLVLRKTCEQIQRWRAAGIPVVPVAINLTTQELYKQGLVTEVLATVSQHDIDPALLEFEITESTAMRSIDDARAILSELKTAGFTLSLDDFGTGYASMSYLSNLPVHGLKIDQSFIAELERDPARCRQTMAIVDAMIGLGLNLGLEVVAEGVETPTQRDFLMAHRCTRGQGFLFSHPQPADVIGSLLQDGSPLPVAPDQTRP